MNSTIGSYNLACYYLDYCSCNIDLLRFWMWWRVVPKNGLQFTKERVVLQGHPLTLGPTHLASHAKTCIVEFYQLNCFISKWVTSSIESGNIIRLDGQLIWISANNDLTLITAHDHNLVLESVNEWNFIAEDHTLSAALNLKNIS